ncbi:hypothetical protein MT418_005642 [Batrachochytrium dendrobatidis]
MTVCEFFVSSQGCSFGASCRFAHISIPEQPALTASTSHSRQRSNQPSLDTGNGSGSRNRRPRLKNAKNPHHSNQVHQQGSTASSLEPLQPKQQSGRSSNLPQHNSQSDDVNQEQQSVSRSFSRGSDQALKGIATAASGSNSQSGSVDTHNMDQQSVSFEKQTQHQPGKSKSGKQKGNRRNNNIKPGKHQSNLDSSNKVSDSLAQTESKLAAVKLVPQQRHPLPSRPAFPRPTPKSLQDRLNETTDPIDRIHILRNLELSQLERRFRSSGYIQSTADQTLNSQHTTIHFDLVPTDPDFPYDLTALHVSMLIPDLFPTDRACRLVVQNKEIPAHFCHNIERAWFKKVMACKLSLLDLVNWLDQNLEGLFIERDDTIITSFRNNSGGGSQTQGATVQDKNIDSTAQDEITKQDMDNSESDDSDEGSADGDGNGDGNGGIHAHDGAGDTDDLLELKEASLSDSDSSLQSKADLTSTDIATSESNSTGIYTASPQKRGTQIRLLESRLDNISLLHCTSITVTIRCTRCRDTAQVSNLLASLVENHPDYHFTCCKTCQSAMSVAFRRDFMHESSQCLGYLDLHDSTAFDLGPSVYIATCTSCNAEHTFKSLPTLTTVTVHCRSCHTALTIQLGQVKFTLVGGGTTTVLQPNYKQLHKRGLAEKKKLLQLGISFGSPLPLNGASCAHFKKSYRWFRFGCCGKIYPCSVCHEKLKEDGHEMIWATKQFCGFCSREQVYSPTKPCVSCGKDLTKRSNGSGFWEGGKGTRDQLKLSSKDSRKFRGLGKTISNRAMNKAKS